MLKPPSPNIPGMTDTLEFVKNLWGHMNVPGAVPGMGGAAVSTDELDKKIADMKAVEVWLNMNLSMLRGTIQALEVQRNTIATLKSMGESMAQAMGQGADAAAPFAQFFAQAAQPSPAPPPEPPRPEQPSAAPDEPAAAAAMPAAVAWWNLLQDQFKQAVTSAMSPEAMAGAAAMAQDAAKRFAEAATPPARTDMSNAKDNGAKEGGGGSAQPGKARPRAPRAKSEKS